MNRLIDHVIDAGYAERVITDRQLARILEGSDDSRYALVKRAVNAGALVRVKRGHYVLADKLRKQPVHPFHLVQALVAGSYVSMESALAYHGWIPEAVFTTMSVTPGRESTALDHPKLGAFLSTHWPSTSSHFWKASNGETLAIKPCLSPSQCAP